ncbi:MAG: hypothetical protein R2715_03845 [Ilumatobacteraceae bacterium]
MSVATTPTTTVQRAVRRRNGMGVDTRRVLELVVAVDWSASASPKTGRDSIWIAARWVDRAGGGPMLCNPATRHEAAGVVRSLVASCAGGVLLGCDFSLGYPVGFAAAVCGDRGLEPWEAMWRTLGESIEDDERNRNNRFMVAASLNELAGEPPGPFWGSPRSFVDPRLGSTRPSGWPWSWPELRRCEVRLRREGYRPFTNWQLGGAGSVGGQVLTGIAWLERLRRAPELEARVTMWPYQTGFVDDPWAQRPDAVVVAEAWPTLLAPDASGHPVRDAAQVLGVSDRLVGEAQGGGLAGWLAPRLTRQDAPVARSDEGWILGAH